MNTTPAIDSDPVVGHLVGAGPVPLTADFFRNLIGENTKMVTKKIETLSEDLLTLLRKVDANRETITKATNEVERQVQTIADQGKLLESLGERVKCLETGSSRVVPAQDLPRTRSSKFLKARRSIRIWPVNKTSDCTPWKGVGEFIHDVLRIPEEEMSQNDNIESVVTIPEQRAPLGNINAEVLITFFCPRKQDLILSHAPNLATFIDSAGRPTAGICLEIPPELNRTFRMLTRFGTQLRARHGEGTKRHIKFDEYEASLFINVKLPGDNTWTRISPAVARANQESSCPRCLLYRGLDPVLPHGYAGRYIETEVCFNGKAV